MSRTITFIVIFWNVVLSILIGYMLTREVSAPTGTSELPPPEIETGSVVQPIPGRDTLAIPDARIAFFSMDSVQERYALVKESADRVRSEGRRLENELAKEIQRAQGRAQELASKDQTYSTQAQLQADQEEFQQLEMKIQELRMRSQEQIEELQIRVLTKISKEVEDFLTEYNATAGFDYIFSIQEGGQIWVGNQQLDITADVVNGLNARHQTPKKGN